VRARRLLRQCAVRIGGIRCSPHYYEALEGSTSSRWMRLGRARSTQRRLRGVEREFDRDRERHYGVAVECQRTHSVTGREH